MPWVQFSVKGWPVHVKELISIAEFSAALGYTACLFEGELLVFMVARCSDLQL